MHELSLVSELVDACLRQAGGEPVALVRVRVAGTVPEEVLRQAFAMLTTETPLESATLTIEPFDMRLSCSCGFDGALAHDDVIGPTLAVCPSCGTLQHRPAVPEIELLEVRVAAPSRAAPKRPSGLLPLSADRGAGRP